MLQDDSRFLQQLFAELKDDSVSVPEARYRELANLLQETCTYSLSLELEDRTNFYAKLCGYGFMAALEGMLTYEDGMVVETAVNILHSVAEFNSSTVRDHILQTAESVNEVNWSGRHSVHGDLKKQPLLLCAEKLFNVPFLSQTQDNHFLNIVISLLVDGEYTGMCVCVLAYTY